MLAQIMNRALQPNAPQILRIGTGDTPAEILRKLAGGWAVNLAAFPKTRRKIELYQGAAAQAHLEAGRVGNEAEAEAWEKVFETFAEILAVSRNAYEARAMAAAKGKKE